MDNLIELVNKAQEWEPKLTTSQQSDYLMRFENEHDHFKNALQFCLNNPNDHTNQYALQLISSLSRFWWMKGHSKEAWDLCSSILTITNRLQDNSPLSDSFQLSLAKAYKGISSIAHSRGDYQVSRQFLEKSLQVFRSLQDEVNIAATQNQLGIIFREQGLFELSNKCHQESLVLYRYNKLSFQSVIISKMSNLWGIALSLNNLGVVAFFQGEDDASEKYHSEALEIRQQIKDTLGIASSLNNLAAIELYSRQNYQKALQLHRETLQIRSELGDNWGIAGSQCCLAVVHRMLGHWEDCAKLHKEALAGFRKVGDKLGISESLEGIAAFQLYLKNYEKAALFYLTSEHIRSSIQAPLPLPKQKDLNEIVIILKTEVTADCWESLKQEAIETTDEIVQQALLPTGLDQIDADNLRK